MKLRRLFIFILAVSLVLSAGLLSPRVFAEPDQTTEPSGSAVYTVEVNGGEATDESGNPVTQVEEGTMVFVRFDRSKIMSYEYFYEWFAYGYSFTGNTSKHEQFSFEMPGRPVAFSARVRVDAQKKNEYDKSVEESIKESISKSEAAESESISISESESESISISESESESERESIEQSIAESISEAEEKLKHYEVGNFNLLIDLNGIEGPEGFLRANDSITFPKTVEAFYSPAYRIYAYYASENGGPMSYYVYNPMERSFFPLFITAGEEEETYAVLAPDKKSDIPGRFVKSLNILLSGKEEGGEAKFVPAYMVRDDSEETLTILYLADENGRRDFYVYGNGEGRTSLIPYEDYERAKEPTGESESSSEKETSSEAASTGQEEERKPGPFSKAFVWILVGLGLVLALLAAVVIVYFVTKRQEEEEESLDFDDEIQPEEEPEFEDEEFRSGYSLDDEEEAEKPFEFDFEDAFPEEFAAEETGRKAGDEILNPKDVDRMSEVFVPASEVRNSPELPDNASADKRQRDFEARLDEDAMEVSEFLKKKD